MSSESDGATVRYAIDAEDNICFIDDAWSQFAEENNGTELTRAAIIRRPLWDFIADDATSKLYQQIVARVRQGLIAQFPIRCDGPAHRRLLQMTIAGAANGSVEFETRALRVESRPSLSLLSQPTPRSSDLLRTCGWCNRMDIGSSATDWVEVEHAVERLRLFELERMPQLTHGMCEACLESMTSTVASMQTNAAPSAPGHPEKHPAD